METHTQAGERQTPDQLLAFCFCRSLRRCSRRGASKLQTSAAPQRLFFAQDLLNPTRYLRRISDRSGMKPTASTHTQNIAQQSRHMLHVPRLHPLPRDELRPQPQRLMPRT